MHDSRFHPRRLALRSSDAKSLLLTFVPVFILLCFGRLLEFSVARGHGIVDIRSALWIDAPVPVALCLAAVLVWFVVRGRTLGHATWPATISALLVVLVGALVLGLVLPWWVTGWLDWRLVGFLKTDSLVVLGLAATIALALSVSAETKVLRTCVLLLLHVVVVSLAIITVADISVLVGTGGRGGYFALREFLANPLGLTPILLSELTPARGVILAIPFAVGLSPLVFRLTFSRYKASFRKRLPLSAVLGVCLPTLALLAIVPVQDSDLYPESSVVRLATMVWEDANWNEDVLAMTGSHENPYDLRDTRLVVTDSTRTMNVVVIVMESVRADALTPYNPELPTTPFLDSLSAHALVVEDMFTTTPYTNKALVSAFAGIPPSVDSDIVEALPGGIPALGLPSLLSEHGYKSVFFTPATLAFERKDMILANLGFEEAFGDGDYATEGFEPKKYFGYEDRVVLAEVMSWVDRAVEEEDPFFMGMLTLTSHHPYDVPASAPRLGLAPWDDELNNYYDAVAYTDAFVRDLFHGFAERGLLDSTLFLIVSDHGEAFGEHGLTTHGNVIWDEALRIPAMMYNPIVFPKGRRIRGPRQLIDLVPTVADVLNLSWEGRMPPGRSFLADSQADRLLFHACKNGYMGVALRMGSHKYLYEYRRRPMRVFNTADDPGERRDIAGELPPGQVQAAESQLVAWLQNVRQAYALAREAPDSRAEDARPSGRFHY